MALPGTFRFRAQGASPVTRNVTFRASSGYLHSHNMSAGLGPRLRWAPAARYVHGLRLRRTVRAQGSAGNVPTQSTGRKPCDKGPSRLVVLRPFGERSICPWACAHGSEGNRRLCLSVGSAQGGQVAPTAPTFTVDSSIRPDHEQADNAGRRQMQHERSQPGVRAIGEVRQGHATRYGEQQFQGVLSQVYQAEDGR